VIELRQLRYVIAAAEAGSFSRAARILNIKQATLSRHILTVEKRLGVILFDRKTRGATLTANGKTYLRTVQRIVNEFAEVNAWVRATNSGHAGRLAVGFCTSFSAGNLRATPHHGGGRLQPDPHAEAARGGLRMPVEAPRAPADRFRKNAPQIFLQR
jgi:DNA-binding transcriptional LysR family regulator